MKISIITVCFNSEDTIMDAINSVISQTDINLEYIIIDGASEDSTIDIVRSFEGKISKFVSESDKGIYDAMNKGLKLATGDIVGFLNSDDVYIDKCILSLVENCFEVNKCDIVYGDLYYVEKGNINKIIRKWITNEYKPDSFSKGWHPPHPAFFAKNKVFIEFGNFNLKFQISADFELMLRFIEKEHIKTAYLAKPIVKMRLGGVSNRNLKNIFIQNIECYRAFKSNGIPVSIFYTLFRLIPKLKQYFK